MGFYLRKSVRVGPFRFNLSKSGVGVSAGVRGLRLGVGPRGNYVHVGRGGLYYRATLPPLSPARERRGPPRDTQGDPPIPSHTHAPLEDIESGDVAQIVDSSSRELLDELNTKRRLLRWAPLTALATLVVLSAAARTGLPGWALGLLGVLCAAGVYAAHARDVLAKTVVLFYDFDPEMESAYGALHRAATTLAQCASTWHIEAQGAVFDRKYHAGASSLVRRKPTSVRRAEPPQVKTNVETVAIGVGRQTLHFFPDRVLVYDPNGVGAVGYRELRITVQPKRFIEDGRVPSDAQVVDRTWQYVNKKGGPDRRFKNNRQLPVCQYDELALASTSGLNEILQVSRCGVGKPFADAIASLARSLPNETSGVTSSA
jgi:hypothetical protein